MIQETLNRHLRARIDEDRLTEILDIATEAFVADGFSATSTNEIARRANSSKTTFYSRFPTKEHLFLAVIERRMTHIFDQVAAALPQEPPLEETLRTFGSRMINDALSKEQIALVRVISKESETFPMLGHRFFELGPKRGQAVLSQYFEGQILQGRLARRDTKVMAQHYASLLTGGPVRWITLGFQSTPLQPRELRKHLDAAIWAFISAYSPERD